MSTINTPGTFDCLEKIKKNPDMPFFLLLASDELAADLVREWAFRAKARGVNPEKVAEAEHCANKMDAWPDKKLPD